jgi:hypothetical protein
MNREERINALIAGTSSAAEPFTETDRLWLKTLADGRFAALEVANDLPRGSTDEEFLAEAPEGVRALVAKGQGADEAIRVAKEAATAAAAVPKTEAEYLAAAPESIRTLVEEKKAADATLKSKFVEHLKTAQSEYTEDELKAMDVKTLARFAKAFRIAEPPAMDFAAMGLSRAAASADDPILNPPDGYKIAIDARNARAASH